ncbi:hypothetical protein [Streptomyces reniochalinae]|uniref:hypothetical protein n=1 Tax=Streptomyces reniochalinae TaxID=2250578 RepID=UPI0015F09BA2|nr:hypothetical protein [Streptomyces reniochalinae]
MPPQPTNQLTPVANAAGRTLCWSLGTAMLINTLHALLHPGAAWWRLLWIGLWVLTAVALLVWAALRGMEKKRFRRNTTTAPHDTPVDDQRPRDAVGENPAA